MITRNEAIDLLTTASAYDRRTVGEGDIAAWMEAAKRAGWSFESAADAIHDHYADGPAWLMPGHITQRIRQGRRQPADVAQVIAIDKPRASDEQRAAAIRSFSERMGAMPDA